MDHKPLWMQRWMGLTCPLAAVQMTCAVSRREWLRLIRIRALKSRISSWRSWFHACLTTCLRSCWIRFLARNWPQARWVPVRLNLACLWCSSIQLRATATLRTCLSLLARRRSQSESKASLLESDCSESESIWVVKSCESSDMGGKRSMTRLI